MCAVAARCAMHAVLVHALIQISKGPARAHCLSRTSLALQGSRRGIMLRSTVAIKGWYPSCDSTNIAALNMDKHVLLSYVLRQ